MMMKQIFCVSMFINLIMQEGPFIFGYSILGIKGYIIAGLLGFGNLNFNIRKIEITIL